MAAANINMSYKTNDLISTDFVSVDPALVSSLAIPIWFCPCRNRNFQNIQQLDSTEKVDSNLILVWALNTKAYK
jgi:hypothetical protein